MPNLTSKKTKTINSSSSIKNQISTILQPVNGTISVSQTTNNLTNAILTQNAVSSSYYIPLLEKITGEQSINIRVPLSFNTTTNTLSVPNLTISNLPTCNVDASNSSDLVNKSYANKYVGFNLSGGDKFYCEDWMVPLNAGINGASTQSIYSTFAWLINNNTNYTLINSIITTQNHIGILRIYPQFTTPGSGAPGTRMLSLDTSYLSTSVKSIRFIVSNEYTSTGEIHLGFGDRNVNGSNNFSIRLGNNTGSLYTMGASRESIDITGITNNWILYEFKLQNNYLSFYIKNLTTGVVIKNFGNTYEITPFIGYIYLYTANPGDNITRYVYIDYIDWVVSS
jgi:hypothetical protein